VISFAVWSSVQRLMQARSELVLIYILGSDELGPDAHDIRLNLTVATGSFAKTVAHAQLSSANSPHVYP
jgi:hypothetical protein